MKIALIEPYVAVDALKSYAEKTEPSHLLGMFNLLQEAGCDVVLLDAYSRGMSANMLVEWLDAESITHAGFTVYDYAPCLTYVKHVFEHCPENLCTVVGGPGPTYCTARMVKALQPDWLVRGAGERAMLALCRDGFQGHHSGRRAQMDRTAVVDSEPMPLADIPFERPYSLESYSFNASPRIQSGCIGKCIFCSGAYQNEFDYMTEEKAIDLLNHLVNEKQAQIISPNGPDLTAIPRRANDFVRMILDGRFGFREFRPGVRLDTLARAIELEPVLWNRLSTKYTVKMEASIESFSTERLDRLGKNMPTGFLDGVYHSLKQILSVCNCTIVLGRIAVDPTITLDEFISDCVGFRRLLHEFPDQITVGGMLMNQFVPLQGTPATEDEAPDNPWTNHDPVDRGMRRLQEELLSNDKFKLWCRLAEDTPDFGDRNYVFEEILRVAGDWAQEMKSACAM